MVLTATSNAIAVPTYSATHKSKLDECLIKAIKNANDHQTVREIKAQCEVKQVVNARNAIDKRTQLEKESSQNPFVIAAHRPNYLMPFTYSELKKEPYIGTAENNDFDNVETVFQVSLKYLAKQNLFIEDLDLELAFTSVSWWQTYNSDISSPFRETNYEPEIIFVYRKPWQLFGLPIDNSFLSLNHESNGKSGKLSRSWNRVIGGLSTTHEDLTFGLKAWWRIPENGLNSAGLPVDDNPDIDDYLGYGEFSMLWQISDAHNLSLMLRNNLKSDNRGAVKLGWSYPLSKRLKGYIEYFNGYGESLIYYNEHVERIGVGIKLTDWL